MYRTSVATVEHNSEFKVHIFIMQNHNRVSYELDECATRTDKGVNDHLTQTVLCRLLIMKN